MHWTAGHSAHAAGECNPKEGKRGKRYVLVFTAKLDLYYVAESFFQDKLKGIALSLKGGRRILCQECFHDLNFPFPSICLWKKAHMEAFHREVFTISGWLKARSAGTVLSLVPLRSNSTLAVRSQSNEERSVCSESSLLPFGERGNGKGRTVV